MEYAMYDYRDKDFKDIKRIHYDSDSNQDNQMIDEPNGVKEELEDEEINRNNESKSVVTHLDCDLKDLNMNKKRRRKNDSKRKRKPSLRNESRKLSRDSLDNRDRDKSRFK